MSISVGVCSNRNNMVGVVTLKQVLMPAILRCDVVMVQNILKCLKGQTEFTLCLPPLS